MFLIIGIILFALLVVVHEYGHFLAARRNGVEVEEFGIGFPPRLFGKKRGSTLYSFNLIPLGGFVRLKGESDAARAKGTFGAARLRAKVKILLAGVGMNVVATFIIILALALTSLPSIIPGQYQVPDNRTILAERVVLAGIRPDSVAARAGLAKNDILLSVAGRQVNTEADLQAIAGDSSGQRVAVSFLRDGEERRVELTLGNVRSGYLGVGLPQPGGGQPVVQSVPSDSAARRIGIRAGDVITAVAGEAVSTSGQLSEVTKRHAGEAVTVAYRRDGQLLQGRTELGTGGVIPGSAPQELNTSRYTWAAPLVALGLTAQMIWLIFSSVGSLIAGLFVETGSSVAAELVGPVGIVVILQNIGVLGVEYLLLLIASISASLAVFNALPIPALDGGRLALIAGFRALKKPLTEKIENSVHGIGFAALMLLFIVITYADIKRFF